MIIPSGCMNYKNTILFLCLTIVFCLPAVVFGQAAYKPLVGIPGIGEGDSDFGKYINALYALSISVAALMAVIKIIIAGVKYMLSDVVTSKSEAISDIRSSVIGLIIVISAVLILTEINPQLAKTEIFVDPVTSTANTPGVGVAGAVETGTGYKAVPLGSNKEFQKDCEDSNGLYRVVSSGGTGKEVCHEPLTAAQNTFLETAFAGNGTDMETLKERYQKAHFPAIENDATKTAAAGAENGGTALLVLKYTEPYDWIDKENFGTLQYTCRELQIASGGKQVIKVVNPKNGYMACVQKN